MQMAMKIVEMRIMSRAMPSGPNCPHSGKHGNIQARSGLRSPKRSDLSINVDSLG